MHVIGKDLAYHMLKGGDIFKLKCKNDELKYETCQSGIRVQSEKHFRLVKIKSENDQNRERK